MKFVGDCSSRKYQENEVISIICFEVLNIYKATAEMNWKLYINLFITNVRIYNIPAVFVFYHENARHRKNYGSKPNHDLLNVSPSFQPLLWLPPPPSSATQQQISTE